MSKIVKLTETELQNLVQRIIKETKDESLINETVFTPSNLKGKINDFGCLGVRNPERAQKIYDLLAPILLSPIYSKN